MCCFFSMHRRPPRSPLFPYTTLFRSLPCGTRPRRRLVGAGDERAPRVHAGQCARRLPAAPVDPAQHRAVARSEEHTSELQSRRDLVCRLLLEKKKNTPIILGITTVLI